MDRTVFAARFSEAAEQSRAFAQTLVSEPLPGDVVVRVRLNRSYPGARLRPGEVTYPGDGGWEQDFALRRCDLGTAVSVLWRDGRVPEWVNLTVVDRDESVTVIEAVCCGRFTADDDLLYKQSGPPPFHILGPPLPPGHDGSRYSLHRRTECWDQADLARLHGTHPLVRSLTICASEFDAGGLTALPALDGMTELRHQRYAAAGDPVAAIARFPRLRIARIHLTGTARPAISGHAASHTVEAFALSGLPDAAWGFANLARALPQARDVDLAATGRLRLGGRFAPGVRRITLRARDLDGPALLPAELDSLGLYLDQSGDDRLPELLAGTRRIRALHLRGTTLSDALALGLPARLGLEFLDLVDTGVTTATIEQIAAAHPSLRLLPSLRPTTPGELKIRYPRPAPST
jgi:hypothetical protein